MKKMNIYGTHNNILTDFEKINIDVPPNKLKFYQHFEEQITEHDNIQFEKDKSIYDFPIDSDDEDSLQLKPNIFSEKNVIDPIKQMIDKIDLK